MLWPDGGPEQPAKTIHVHVSRLRRALAEPPAPSLLETHTGSYVLRVGPGELDVDDFTALVAAGREALAAGDPAAASVSLTQALGLWRGKAFADFTYEPFAQAEIAQLEELRLGAVELAVEADLALGRHAMAVPRLERLTAEHPMRERMHGQLMLALYRCGRQADALAAYRRLRQTLDSELGLEPGPELRRLEQRILRQEADLEGEAPQPATSAAAPTPAAAAEPRVPLPDPLAHAASRPLAGREAELSGIAEVAAGLAGSRHLVLLSGDAGIGKTRLLAEAAARLHADGWPVLYGRADEDSPVPYQPFVEALRHHLAHRPRLALSPAERLPSAAAPLSALAAGARAAAARRAAADVGGAGDRALAALRRVRHRAVTGRGRGTPRARARRPALGRCADAEAGPGARDPAGKRRADRARGLPRRRRRARLAAVASPAARPPRRRPAPGAARHAHTARRPRRGRDRGARARRGPRSCARCTPRRAATRS